MKNEELRKHLEHEGYMFLTEIPGRGLCGLYRFLFTTGLVIGIDQIGYKGRYCYSERSDALYALSHWDGTDDPPGPWIKYKGEGGERSNTLKTLEHDENRTRKVGGSV